MLQVTLFTLFLFVSVSSFQIDNNVCSHDIYYPLRFIDNIHCKRNPDVFSNIEDIIARHNFPVQSYTHVNSEGYIMTLHRIPSQNQSKPIIYLQHGFVSNSVTFVDVNNRSLAFYLSSLGYDVWMGNLRGVRDCKQHVFLSPKDPKFWNFNMDDLAAVDVRENLLFISNATGKAGSIIYLGFSMGTTLSYMYASRYPQEAKALLKGIISLAPVAFVDGTNKDWFRKVGGPPAAFFAQILGISTIIYHEKTFGKLASDICNAAPWACRLYIGYTFGLGDQIASEDLPIFASSFWGSVSRNQIVHYLQILQSKKLQMYDFKHNNPKHYGQEQPPVYDLRKIALPLFLFYGLKDRLATPRKAERLYRAVGSQKKRMFKIPESDDSNAFNHLDFLYSKYMDKFLFPKLNQVLLELS